MLKRRPKGGGGGGSPSQVIDSPTVPAESAEGLLWRERGAYRVFLGGEWRTVLHNDGPYSVPSIVESETAPPALEGLLWKNLDGGFKAFVSGEWRRVNYQEGTPLTIPWGESSAHLRFVRFANTTAGLPVASWEAETLSIGSVSSHNQSHAHVETVGSELPRIVKLDLKFVHRFASKYTSGSFCVPAHVLFRAFQRAGWSEHTHYNGVYDATNITKGFALCGGISQPQGAEVSFWTHLDGAAYPPSGYITQSPSIENAIRISFEYGHLQIYINGELAVDTTLENTWVDIAGFGFATYSAGLSYTIDKAASSLTLAFP